MDFIERLESLLKEKGVSATKMSLDLGFSKDAAFNWKKRGTIPSGEMLAKVADYFGVTVDYLLGRVDTLASIQNITAAHLKGGVDISDLPEEDQQDIMNYIAFRREQRKKG